MTGYISTRLATCITLAVIIISTDCSKTDSLIKNAYTMMSKGLCGDALAPLQEVLKNEPDNEKLLLALCEANICDKLKKSDAQQVEAYCKGSLEAGERAFIAYAFYLNLAEKKAQSLQILQEGLKKYPQSKEIEWFLHFDIFSGDFQPKDSEAEVDEEDVGSDFPRIGIDSLGDVLQTVSGCLANDNVKGAIVRRSDANIYLPGEDKVENRLEPATVVAVKDASSNRITFQDRFHEHWKTSIGWVLVRQDFLIYETTYAYDPKFAYKAIKVLKKFDLPKTNDNFYIRETFNPDPQYVFRNLPDISEWRDFKKDCKWLNKEYHSITVSCAVDHIQMKPGSFKVLEEVKMVENTPNVKCFGGYLNRCRAVYKKVQFEEPDAPLRELKNEEVPASDGIGIFLKIC